MARANTLSPEVVASDGTLLRAFLSPDGAWRIHTAPRDVSPRYLLLLKAYEDRRFDAQAGVDVMALGPAASQWLGAGHVVSGGSTLTMQVALFVVVYWTLLLPAQDGIVPAHDGKPDMDLHYVIIPVALLLFFVIARGWRWLPACRARQGEG